MADPIRDLLPGANFISRPRLSKLTYTGQKKITRLQSRSAIVAFSANDVYAIAELIRRQRGGAAVVLGALSPRTRNAQVALYQSGEVDFLVATDAIGMGLNLDVDHVAFAGSRKFDGRNHRNLTPAELGQIAGRAGRHLNDGTFGVTGDVEPFEQELVNKLENHDFEPVKVLQWRNTQLDFESVDRLKDSLRQHPGHARLSRARTADDLETLELACNDARILELTCSPAAVKTLWDVCQVPDYRKVAPSSHAELVATLYKYIMSEHGVIPEDWFAGQVEQADRTDGDIDTLSNRISHIRTWTFVSNRREWLKDPDHWQARTREIEDRLSDALHEQLTQRFVDKRTSVLMKSMRDKDSLFAEIEKDGRVVVEKQHVGKLVGFCFTPDAATAGLQGKAARNAAAKVLVHELAARADRLGAAPDTAFGLTRDGKVVWESQEIGRLAASDDPLKPSFILNSDEHLAAIDKGNITDRIETWLAHHFEVRLKPLVEIAKAEEITGLARGIAFRLRENFGILRRETIAEEMKSLDQEGRAQLRKYGVRFGAHHIYFPLLLKPAAADLLLLLWLLKHGGEHNLTTAAVADSPRQGLTSVPRNSALPDAFYRAAGFHVCGNRVVRVDMLERLADIIRPLTAWRPTDSNATPPVGAAGGGAFRVRPEMMSIMGCSGDELALILESLGFRKERRPLKKEPAEAAPKIESAEAPAIAANDNNPSLPRTAGEALAETTSADTAANEGSSLIEGDRASEPLQEADGVADAHQVASTANGQGQGVSPDGEQVHAAPQAIQSEAISEAEFEEVWRFRRPKPKFERPQGQGDRRHQRKPGERGHRPHYNRPHTPGEGQPAAASQPNERRRDQAGARKEEGQGQTRHHDRNRQHSPKADRGREGLAQEATNAVRGGEPSPQRQKAEDSPQGRGEHRQRHERGNERKRDSRPHHHQGKQLIAASASPKKAAGSVDPDSPFAALSQLKERMEKQVQTQEEAI